MCTVSYLKTKTGFVLTQNRDESPSRHVHEVQSEGSVYYPIDPVSKGTWMAVNEQGIACSIMNWSPHPALPPKVAEISRGTLIPKVIQEEFPIEALMKLPLAPYAPFKIVVATEDSLQTLIWDGVTKKVESLDSSIPHIWSSSSLYPREWQEKRKEWFFAWLERMGTVNTTEVLWFHNHGGIGDRQYDLVMDRGPVRTTSITQLTIKESRARIRYKDLSTCLVEEHWMSLKKPHVVKNV